MVRWSSTGRRGGSLAAEPRITARPDSVGRYRGKELQPAVASSAQAQKPPAAAAVVRTAGGALVTKTAAATSKPPLAAPVPQKPPPQQMSKSHAVAHPNVAQGASKTSTSQSRQELRHQAMAPSSRPRPPPAPSEAGTHADWWQQRPGSSSSSVISYPMTAVRVRVHQVLYPTL